MSAQIHTLSDYISDDDLVLLPEGEYQLSYQHHATWYYMGRFPKIVVAFRVFDLGEHNDKPILAYYNPSKIVGKSLLNKAAPTIEELKDNASLLYSQIDDLGVSVNAEFFENLTKRLNATAKAFSFNPNLQKKTGAVLKGLEKRIGESPTFTQLDGIRKELGAAAIDGKPSDSALASKLIQRIDGLLEDVPENAINSGSKAASDQASTLLKQARGEVFKRKKAETIAAAIQKGKDAASGSENGIRSQMRSVLNRITDGKLKGYTSEEVKQIRQVATGQLSGANMLRLIGKGSFGGDGSANFLGGSIGVAASGSVGGTPLIIAQQAASIVAKKAASKATTGEAQFIEAIARAGQNSAQIAREYVKAVPRGKRSADELADILRELGGDLESFRKLVANAGGENKKLVQDVANILAAERNASAR